MDYATIAEVSEEMQKYNAQHLKEVFDRYIKQMAEAGLKVDYATGAMRDLLDADNVADFPATCMRVNGRWVTDEKDITREDYKEWYIRAKKTTDELQELNKKLRKKLKKAKKCNNSR